MIETYTIGSDPEGFLFDPEKSKFIPAVGLIGGDKEQPRRINNQYAVLEDNVMVEFNIPPSVKGERLGTDIGFMTKHIQTDILDSKYEIIYTPSVLFNPEDLQHPKCYEFGCEPDLDVWLKDERCLLETQETNVRYAGGHIHFGYKDPDEEESVKLVKLFDLFLGVPSVFLDENSDRRATYGKAGAFRFKEYGFEYRTLSNFWVNGREKQITSLIEKLIDSYNNGIDVEPKAKDAINNNDVDLAKQLIKKYNIKL